MVVYEQLWSRVFCWLLGYQRVDGIMQVWQLIKPSLTLITACKTGNPSNAWTSRGKAMLHKLKEINKIKSNQSKCFFPNKVTNLVRLLEDLVYWNQPFQLVLSASWVKQQQLRWAYLNTFKNRQATTCSHTIWFDCVITLHKKMCMNLGLPATNEAAGLNSTFLLVLCCFFTQADKTKIFNVLKTLFFPPESGELLHMLHPTPETAAQRRRTVSLQAWATNYVWYKGKIMWPFSGEGLVRTWSLVVNELGLDDYELHSSPGCDIETRSDQG